MSNGNSTRYDRFNNFIHSNNLINIGSICNPFTWHNKRPNRNVVYARLDLALARFHIKITNHLWLTLHPNAILSTFPIFGSNYGPIFLILSISNPLKNSPMFKFEAK